jgi:hypothetical protein
VELLTESAAASFASTLQFGFGDARFREAALQADSKILEIRRRQAYQLFFRPGKWMVTFPVNFR